jgi:hypothetical protein
MAVWLPGYTIVQLGKTGGPYDATVNPKLCWHTTEGGTVAGAETAFYPYPPHLCVDPDTGERHQYIGLDRHAYSLGNSDAEDSYVIQVEVVGYASEAPDWPPQRLQWLGEHVAGPVQQAIGVPPVACPYGFHGEGEGIILASSSSPIRLTIGEWDNFAGHVGHQHCPGDDHWDPGRLDIARILAAAGGTPAPQRTKDDDMPYFLFAPHGGGRWWITDLRTNSRPCDTLDDAVNTDYFLREVAKDPDGLRCNRDRDGHVAGPIAVDDHYLDQVTRHAAAEP